MQNGTHTQVEFRRNLETCDPHDIAITVSEKNKVYENHTPFPYALMCFERYRLIVFFVGADVLGKSTYHYKTVTKTTHTQSQPHHHLFYYLSFT